jgi:MarR family 2-MHQ and catechol resistance regulon transcriptional repressor
MPSHYAGCAEKVRALSAFINLMRAADTLGNRLARKQEALGLTESQFGALEALHHLGPMTQKELAGKLLKSTANTSLVLANLEKAGLVQRDRLKDDLRCYQLSLSNKGKKLIEESFPSHAQAITTMMNALNAEELETLRVLCRKLGKASL